MNIVLTGGPFSGKTTLLHEMRKMGYPVVEEVAIDVIQREIATRGVVEFQNWKRHNLVEFQTTILAEQKRREDIVADKVIQEAMGSQSIIFDRGTLDGIAYLEYHGVTPSASFVKSALNSQYDLVLICETLPDFDSRQNTGRSESGVKSHALSRVMGEVYHRYGYLTMKMETLPVLERTNRLISYIVSANRESS